MPKRKLPILSIVSTGTSAFPRYAIADDGDRLWAGDGFNQESGLIYASHQQAAHDTHRILKGFFPGVEPARYVVPVEIEVYSDQALHMLEVARHLSQAAKLYIDTPKHGNGPGDSLVLPVIHWPKIEPSKPQ